MFLSALSGGVVALALVAQATSFGDRLTVFALLLLMPIPFLGVATFARLVEINREDIFRMGGDGQAGFGGSPQAGQST